MSPTLWRVDPERLGLSEFVRGQLLEGDEDLKGMRTELYKLNVYGQCLPLLTMPGLELSRVKKPSISYVGFYSDVEHEVTIAESGYRVSLTYNLYVSAPTQQENMLSTPLNCVMPNELNLKQALSELLDEKIFLPEGGSTSTRFPRPRETSRTRSTALKGAIQHSDASARRLDLN